MDSKKIGIKICLLAAAFIAFYFYLKFANVTGLFQFLAIGTFMAVIAYSVFADGAKLIFRITISIVIIILAFLLPKFLSHEEEEQSQVNVLNKEKIKLLGNWNTDTVGGYSIGLKIQNDSANLSQSNLNISKKFEWKVNDDFFELINEQSDQYYSWRFELIENDNILILKSRDDILLFRRYKF